MEITLRILDGADQGHVFDELTVPVTIGREEGNTIQLNDERVSRFHAKIQHDQDKVILTDLESTNGTKVNGSEIRLRILRHGDLINIGRSLLLYGSEEQIAQRLADLRTQSNDEGATISAEDFEKAVSAASLDFELSWSENPEIVAALHSLQTPELPDGLSPGQAAQLSELLEYLHLRLRDLVATVEMDDSEERVILAQRQWQNVLDLQSRMSVYLRKISDPNEGVE